MIRTVKKLHVVSAAIMLSVALAGCTASGNAPQDPGTSGGASTGETDSGPGNDGRAFNSTDDAVITAISAALKPDDVTWEGKSLKVRFNDGSVEDPTAGIGCLAIVSIIADDEKGFIVYPDGEFDCSTRY